jgi:hypothetical protein
MMLTPVFIQFIVRFTVTSQSQDKKPRIAKVLMRAGIGGSVNAMAECGTIDLNVQTEFRTIAFIQETIAIDACQAFTFCVVIPQVYDRRFPSRTKFVLHG